MHELVETSLVCSPSEGRLLPDLGWGTLGLKVHLNNYTRWFREGLASYAGYVAHEIVSNELALFKAKERPSIPLTIWRKSEETVTLEIPVQPSGGKLTASAKTS